jgi:protocatechuate 3,4-dioxygenase beta subunit
MTNLAPLLFQGMLLNQQGAAIQNAKVQLWQTDPNGNYLHPDPGAALNPISPDHASIVSDFQYFGTDATDSDGRFHFLTYRPGLYPSRPYSHFHFMVWLNDVDSGEFTKALVTQFYFKDELPPYPEMLQLDVVKVVSGELYDYGSYVNGTIVIESEVASLDGDATLEITPEQSLGPFYPIPDFFSMDNDLTTMDDASTRTANPTVSPETATSSPPTIAPVTANILTKSPTCGPRIQTLKSSEEENVGSQGTEGVETAVEDKVEEAAEPSRSSAYWHSLTTVIIGFTLLNTALAA